MADFVRTIHASPLSLTEIATQVGITPLLLDEFLTGERTLRSDLMDRLAAVMGYGLMPIRTSADSRNGVAVCFGETSAGRRHPSLAPAVWQGRDGFPSPGHARRKRFRTLPPRAPRSRLREQTPDTCKSPAVNDVAGADRGNPRRTPLSGRPPDRRAQCECRDQWQHHAGTRRQPAQPRPSPHSTKNDRSAK